MFCVIDDDWPMCCGVLLQYALFLVLMVTAEIVLGVVIAVMHEQVRITRSATRLNCLAVFADHSPCRPDHARLKERSQLK